MTPLTSGARIVRALAAIGNNEVIVMPSLNPPSRARFAIAASMAGGSPTALPCTIRTPSRIAAAASSAVLSFDLY